MPIDSVIEPDGAGRSVTLEQWIAKWKAYSGPVLCVDCRQEVESDRRPPQYVRPTCYKCLPNKAIGGVIKAGTPERFASVIEKEPRTIAGITFEVLPSV